MAQTIFYSIVGGGVVLSLILLIGRGIFGLGDSGTDTDSLGGKPESLEEQRDVIFEIGNIGTEQRDVVNKLHETVRAGLELTEKQRSLFNAYGESTEAQSASLDRQRRAIEELQKRIK